MDELLQESKNITNINCNINRSVGQVKLNGIDINSIVTAFSGLGEKTNLLVKHNMYSTLAKDIVSSSFNKLASTGADIIGFSQYLLSDEKPASEEVEKELALELKKYNCSSMSVKIEQSGDNSAFCGLALGVNSIQKEEIVSGDIVIGLASDGLHFNGYEKVSALYKGGFLSDEEYKDTLKPALNYYYDVIDLYKKNKIKLGVNITKGGIYTCLNKVLPKGLKADLNLKHIPPQPIFEKLKDLTGDEFYNIFNGGIGFCLIAERACDEIFFKECQKYNPIILGVIE